MRINAVKLGRFILATLAVLVTVGLALSVLVLILKPGPPSRVEMATGGSGGAYHEMALRYQRELATLGITLVLRPDVEGTDTLKALLPQYKAEFKGYDERNANIMTGFVKGGFASSLQGRYASLRQQVWHERQVNDLVSLGRLFYEPLWVFTRSGEQVKSLRDLKGKKIMLGPSVSGTRAVVRHILQANGVTGENSTFVEQEFPATGAPLVERQVDAAFMFLPPESPKVQTLLRNPQLVLMDFSTESNAYTIRFPALSKVILRQGAIEFGPDIPATDVTLLATSVALVARSTLAPSLQALLAQAAISNPKSGFDSKGEPILFYQAGEFPSANDPEYVVPPNVRQLYKTGELPTVLRAASRGLAQLHLPFWPAAFLYEHGTQTILFLIPLLSILVPMFHYLPILYKWGIRQRLLNRYQQLKALEASIDEHPDAADLAEMTHQLDRIDAAVRRVSVPLYFSDQLYDLRAHIDLVRRRLEQMSRTARTPSIGQPAAQIAQPAE